MSTDEVGPEEQAKSQEEGQSLLDNLVKRDSLPLLSLWELPKPKSEDDSSD